MGDILLTKGDLAIHPEAAPIPDVPPVTTAYSEVVTSVEVENVLVLRM